MDREKTSHYLKSLHRVLNIPIAYGVLQNDDMQYFMPFSIVSENDPGFIYGRLKHVFVKFPEEHALYAVTKNLIMMGILVNHTTHEFVFVGPIASEAATEENISDYLFETGLSARTAKKMSNYMTAVRPLNLYGLKELLSNINLILNDEILDAAELTAIYDDDTREQTRFVSEEFVRSYYQDKRDTVQVAEYTQKLTYCLQNGDLTGLSDLLNDIGGIPYYAEGQEDSLSERKLTAYGSIFAAEAAAMKSDADVSDLERIKQYYLHRIESAQSKEDISSLCTSALFEYTKYVKDHLAVKAGNPSITRAIEYIKSNINSQLGADEIANAIHVSPHYLFVNFKEETGMTLTQFINREKINKACYYLMFTDKPLIEIAMHLSFSSQSYFQSVFKKQTGKTPAEWRKDNIYENK